MLNENLKRCWFHCFCPFQRIVAWLKITQYSFKSHPWSIWLSGRDLEKEMPALELRGKSRSSSHNVPPPSPPRPSDSVKLIENFKLHVQHPFPVKVNSSFRTRWHLLAGLWLCLTLHAQVVSGNILHHRHPRSSGDNVMLRCYNVTALRCYMTMFPHSCLIRMLIWRRWGGHHALYNALEINVFQYLHIFACFCMPFNNEDCKC